MPDIKVFLSYSRRDRPFVDQLAGDLRSRGVDVWLDTEDIVRSADNAFRRAIVDGIVGSAAVIVVLSPDSVASTQVERELNVAADHNRRVVPIVYRPCTIPNSFQYVLAGLQRIDFSDHEYAKALEQLELQLTAGDHTGRRALTPQQRARRRRRRRRIALIAGSLIAIGAVASSYDPPPTSVGPVSPAATAGTPPTVASSCDLERVPQDVHLDVGDTGDDVRRLQEALLQLGILPSEDSVDGTFGLETKAAVERFQAEPQQQQMGITVDGQAGPVTRTAICDLLAAGS